MTYAIESLFDQANEHLERERRRLQTLSVSDPSDPYDKDGLRAMTRALTYVVCGGVLEQLVRDLPTAISSDLIAHNPSRAVLPIGLVAVLDAEMFRKCSANNVGTLIARADLLRSITAHHQDSRPARDFSESLRLADGTTINVKHFEALWAVLGLPGNWTNRPNDLFMIRELAEKRNTVAHWEGDPIAVGRSRTAPALVMMLDQLGDLLEYIHLHISAWLDQYNSTAS